MPRLQPPVSLCSVPKPLEVSSCRCFLLLAAQHTCLPLESHLRSAGFKAPLGLETSCRWVELVLLEVRMAIQTVNPSTWKNIPER